MKTQVVASRFPLGSPLTVTFAFEDRPESFRKHGTRKPRCHPALGGRSLNCFPSRDVTKSFSCV